MGEGIAAAVLSASSLTGSPAWSGDSQEA